MADTPPFYAWPLGPGITFTYLGVGVNDRAQILMADGTPSGNMFAAGEIMTGLAAAFTLKNLEGGAGEGCTYPAGRHRNHHRLRGPLLSKKVSNKN